MERVGEGGEMRRGRVRLYETQKEGEVETGDEGGRLKVS